MQKKKYYEIHHYADGNTGITFEHGDMAQKIVDLLVKEGLEALIKDLV